jgi:hypothetical protein
MTQHLVLMPRQSQKTQTKKGKQMKRSTKCMCYRISNLIRGLKSRQLQAARSSTPTSVCLAIALGLAATTGASTARAQTGVRVPGFLPSVNGLHFANNWPPNTPDYTLGFQGQTVTVGDANNGLCGGMVYTVKDLFDTGFLPPTNVSPPPAGSALFNYIVVRLTGSFDWDDVNQYLSWIQMSDHDTGFDTPFGHVVTARGLAWHEITEEWQQKIKPDLDASRLCPLGLVAGQEPSTVGFFIGLKDLGNCHQVLAYGYDLQGSQLKIQIYDPDSPNDNNACITLDISNPQHTTPLSVSGSSQYRGFFRTHYTYHDPRTPDSAAFVATVVSSPGITSPGPTPRSPAPVPRPPKTASVNERLDQEPFGSRDPRGSTRLPR